MVDKHKADPVPLFKWIWRSFLRTALIPLLMVELVFVGIYFYSSVWSKQENIIVIRETARNELKDISQQQADIIEQQMIRVQHLTEFYQRQTAIALAKPASLSKEDAKRLAYDKSGAYYTTRDKTSGGVAVYYSGYVTVGELERQKVAKLLTLEPLMKDILHTEKLVDSLYFNSFDSLNVIYPYFEVLKQYPPKMNIPTYNFYYQADLQNNPDKKIKWTEVYLDPAGHGWMTSCIAPVYKGNYLEGVVGIDITVDTIINRILTLQIPWQGYGILLSQEGKILALPKQGEEDFNLKELTNHHYTETVKRDMTKSETFRLSQHPELNKFSDEVNSKATGLTNVKLRGKQYLVSWSTVPETNWKLLILAPEQKIYAPANQLSADLNKVGTMMIGGLVLFYMVFFFFLYKKSRQMSKYISQPLLDLNNVVHRIGAGEYQQLIREYPVIELNETALGLMNMGNQLAKATNQLVERESELRYHKENLEQLVEERTNNLKNMNKELINEINIRQMVEYALRESEARYRRLAENSPDVIFRITLNLSPQFEYISPAVNDIAGYHPSAFYGSGYRLLEKHIDPDDLVTARRFLPGKDCIENTLRWLHPDGRTRWLEYKYVRVYDDNDQCIALEGVVRDITDRKKAEQRLKYLSQHDSLTGLYNRAYFEQELLKLKDYCHLPISIIVGDVNGLKLINDSFGHQYGDNLLKEAAKIIKMSVEKNDVVARIGGDEFSVLLVDYDKENAEKVIGKINQNLNNYNQSNLDLPLSISIGVATNKGEKLTLEELFKIADDHMYREKLHTRQSNRSALVRTLMKALEARDYLTEGHGERLQELTMKLAEALNLPKNKLVDVQLLAKFHDIGKVGIPDQILHKPEKLNSEECNEIQRHSEIGYRIAKSAPELETIAELILRHHEWWNGKGYPLGLKGEEIPLECRILSIVDAYDAMTNDRPYRKAISHEEAVAELQNCAGEQFDPSLVPTFIYIASKI